MSNIRLIDGHIDGAEQCVICGRDIPEGSQVCVICGKTEPRDLVEVVRCRDCIQFSEYHETYKPKVENADGDCFYRLMHSCDKQFFAVRYDDFCSYGERRGKE